MPARSAARRSTRPVGVVLFVLAGLLAMHGVTAGAALASGGGHADPTAAAGMTAMPGMTGMTGMTGSPAQPAQPASARPERPGPAPVAPLHHGPSLSGHSACLAALTATTARAAAPAVVTRTAPRGRGKPAQTALLARAGADRAPPDLDELCVSRT